MSAQYSELRWAVMETDEGLVPLTPTEHRGPGAASWRSGTRGRVERDAEGYPAACPCGRVWDPVVECYGDEYDKDYPDSSCRVRWDDQMARARKWPVRGCCRDSPEEGKGGPMDYRYRSRKNYLRRLKAEARRAGGGR